MIERADAHLYRGFCEDLVVVHDELRALTSAAHRALLEELVRPETVRPTLERLLDRLERHHRAEDVFFFPAFRAAGRLSSSDAEFLDECDREHRDIVDLSQTLRANLDDRSDSAAERTRWSHRLRGQLGELEAIVEVHFFVEETGLTVELLQHAVKPQELKSVYADMHSNWRTR